MPEAFSKFEWIRAQRGYWWVKGIPLERTIDEQFRWYLTDGSTLDRLATQEDSRATNPDPVGLFHRLTAIDYRTGWEVNGQNELVPTLAGNPIITFATTYGLLTKGEAIQVIGNAAPDEDILIGEPIDLWEREIDALWQVLELWKKLHPRVDLKALSKVIRWKSNTAVYYDPSGRWEGLGEKRIFQVPGITLAKGNFERAAWWYLRQIINARLSAYVSPHLAVETYYPLSIQLRFTCPSLLGYIWLQLAQFIDQGDFRKCEFCGTLFVIAPGAARSNRRYCKDSCRVMDCRKRKASQASIIKKKRKTAE